MNGSSFERAWDVGNVQANGDGMGDLAFALIIVAIKIGVAFSEPFRQGALGAARPFPPVRPLRDQASGA